MFLSSRPSLLIASVAATGAVTFAVALSGVAGLDEELRAAAVPPPAPAPLLYETAPVAGPPAPEGTITLNAGCDDRSKARDAATGVTGPRGL